MDIEQMPGPMVLWFDGEGRDCLLCDGPTQVIDHLMDEEGAGWSLDGTKDDLLQCLNNEDNWTRNEAGQPFQVTIPIEEISTANVLVKCRSLEVSRFEQVSESLHKKLQSLMYYLTKEAARTSYREFLEFLDINEDEYIQIKEIWREKLGVKPYV